MPAVEVQYGTVSSVDRPLPQPGKLRGYEFYRTVLNSPKRILAPMVDHSEYAWRLLSKRYNTDLVFTPMMHSKHFVDQPKSYPARNYVTGPGDRPLVAQFCGNDPYYLVRAALKVQDTCDAVDLNLGCPQGIAKRGHYGAFLMEELDLICQIVHELDAALSIPVTCKIRCFSDLKLTINYAKRLVAAGCAVLTVHGRTREMKGPHTGLANWDWIKAVKEAVSIPVIANGNILYGEDVEKCLQYTGCEGVMSAEANLYNPAVFASQFPFTVDIAREYLQIVKENPGSSRVSIIKAHLFKLFYRVLDDYPHIRDVIPKTWELAGFDRILDELQVVLTAERAEYEASNGGVPFDPRNCKIDSETGLKVIPRFYCQPYVRSSMTPRQTQVDEANIEKILERRKRKALAVAQRKPNPPKKPLKVCVCKKVCSDSCIYQLCRDCCKLRVASEFPVTPTGPPRPDAQLQCNWNAVYHELIAYFAKLLDGRRLGLFELPANVLSDSKVYVHNYATTLLPHLPSPKYFDSLQSLEDYLSSNIDVNAMVLYSANSPLSLKDSAQFKDVVFPSSAYASGIFAVELVKSCYRARRSICASHKLYRHQWVPFKTFKGVIQDL